jgi:hypothetical protein
MRRSRLSTDIGNGILAGVVGTAAMTLSSTLEAKLRRRPYSKAPAKAAARALGIETFEDGDAYARFSNLVHWGYGTSWGVACGLLRTLGLGPRLATPAHFAAVWGSSLYTLPKYEVAPPVTEWAIEDIAIDVFHHLVYVGATMLAFGLLDRGGRTAEA